MFLDGITQHADIVDQAFLYIVGFSILMLLGVTGAMVYFVWKYRASKHPVPIQTHGSVWIETVWVVIPTIICISMFAYGYVDFNNIRNFDNTDMTVQVTGRMWEWVYKYENGVEFVSKYQPYPANKVDNYLKVPLGKKIKFDITAVDVIHSFYIPAMRIKEDAVPGRMHNYVIFPEKPGIYDIACAEYCGVNHSMMYSKIEVMPEDEFAAWYKKEELKLTSNGEGGLNNNSVIDVNQTLNSK